MYLRYAERRGWKTEVLSATESDLGGYKDVTVAIKAPGSPTPADGVWARLKFEGGVHRVQRVPVTESSGRIHTSAAGDLRRPRGRRDRRRGHRSQRSADRRVPLLRPWWAVGEHDRFGRSRSRICRPGSSCPARTRSRSCRTRSRRCGSCVPACWPPRGPTAEAAVADAAALAGANRGPLGTRADLQLPGEPHRRPPGRLQGLQPRCRARRRARRACWTRWPPQTAPNGSAPLPPGGHERAAGRSSGVNRRSPA